VLQKDAKYTVENNTYHQCLQTVLRRIKNLYRKTMGQERLDSLSLLCIEADTGPILACIITQSMYY